MTSLWPSLRTPYESMDVTTTAAKKPMTQRATPTHNAHERLNLTSGRTGKVIHSEDVQFKMLAPFTDGGCNEEVSNTSDPA